jgi:hypothetical protein
MRTGLYDIEALGREPARVRVRSTSSTRRLKDRRAARDVGAGESDKRGRDPDAPARAGSTRRDAA